MSSRLSRLLHHTPNLVLSLFLIAMGLFGMGLAFSAAIRTEAITFILEQRWALFFVGLTLLLSGIILVGYVEKTSRRRYASIKTGQRACLLDESFIEQYLETYWKNLFPAQDIAYNLTIKKNKIKITAEFPALPPDEQKSFLEKQRHELRDLFGRLLGYPHDIILAASFKTNND